MLLYVNSPIDQSPARRYRSCPVQSRIRGKIHTLLIRHRFPDIYRSVFSLCFKVYGFPYIGIITAVQVMAHTLLLLTKTTRHELGMSAPKPFFATGDMYLFFYLFTLGHRIR